jgi:UDP-N-acetylmuramate: L-alanyl-gamma-D-glutamyl-meso-diaminopimelate ligase
MQDRLTASLDGADRVLCYAHDLGWDPAAALRPLGTRASVHLDIEGLVDTLARELQPGDQVLMMSNGSFAGAHERLLARLGRAAADSPADAE